jgi:hypothetical protein
MRIGRGRVGCDARENRVSSCTNYANTKKEKNKLDQKKKDDGERTRKWNVFLRETGKQETGNRRGKNRQ